MHPLHRLLPTLWLAAAVGCSSTGSTSGTPACKPVTPAELAAVKAGIQQAADASAPLKAFTQFRTDHKVELSTMILQPMGFSYTWNGKTWDSLPDGTETKFKYSDGTIATATSVGETNTWHFETTGFVFERDYSRATDVLLGSGSAKDVTLLLNAGEWKATISKASHRSSVHYKFPGGQIDTEEIEGGGQDPRADYDVKYSFDSLEIEAKTGASPGFDVVTVNGSTRCSSSAAPLKEIFPDVWTLIAIEDSKP